MSTAVIKQEHSMPRVRQWSVCLQRLSNKSIQCSVYGGGVYVYSGYQTRAFNAVCTAVECMSTAVIKQEHSMPRVRQWSVCLQRLSNKSIQCSVYGGGVYVYSGYQTRAFNAVCTAVECMSTAVIKQEHSMQCVRRWSVCLQRLSNKSIQCSVYGSGVYVYSGYQTRAFNAVCTAVECMSTAVIKQEHSMQCVRQWSVCLQRLSNKSIQCSVYGGGVYVYSGYQTRAFNAACTAVECMSTAVIKQEHSMQCVRRWSVCLQRLSNKSIQCRVYGGVVYVYSGYQTRAFNAVCTAVECMSTAVIKQEHSMPCVRRWSVCLQRLSNKSIQCRVYGRGVYVYSGYQTRAFNAVCTAVECMSTAVIK